ncbi:DEAD/DEAH box helicase family protein [candidate division KSB1 bacterium]|nr:DEAD/DEAH box helicase family protein [bacterium]NUM67887.1 DEAD/DEAH box helicase family protein [candidate division KSB1 bacterium]
MAFEITERNASALEPLFKPWEEPTLHRLPNPQKGEAAIIQPGRRPSKCPLVRSIRAQVDGWRRGGYAGVSDTSRKLMSFWFNTEHQVEDEDGNAMPFRYHWAQREAIETIIYLYEMRRVRNVAELLFEFGDDTIADLALGINPEEDRWAKYCSKIATGGGKTKVMSLAIVWSYFHSLYEPDSSLAQHFVIIAPNLTVYERLKDDFENCKIFYQDPLLPEDWAADFKNQMQVVLQDSSGGTSTRGAIYLTNIHRLHENRGKSDNDDSPTTSIFGPPVKKAQALDTGATLRDRITSHPRLMVLNDEAHHLHDADLAWNRAIEALQSQSLSKGNAGICLQLDYTATPKHNNGELFRHIICDFPLGEAVDAGIVKVPVLGESDELVVHGDKKAPAHERYAMHLKLGYQRYKKTFEEYSKVRKPILFVMTEDADAANEIADYLDSKQFPLLKGRVLNLHTRLKGRIKKVTRNGREIKEFVENETAMKPEDLRELREMSRELDAKDSKFRCVVSVMMLREGWDVRNVTTIVPLRPYSAKSGILPEQTLGRGLRRMFPTAETPEMVTVVHHPAFRKLYEDELAQEGLDIAVLPIREAFKQTVTIFVDHEHKPVENLAIEIPLISDAIETTNELQGLTFEAVRDYFQQRYQPLPIGQKKDGPVEYKERHLFTDEIVSRMQLDAGLLTNAWSAAGYFAQMLGRVCKLSNPHQVLAPLLEKFISKVLFEREVDLYAGEIDHRMRDTDVQEHVRATLTPLILQKTVQKKDRKRISQGQPLSAWQPFQATSNDKRPAVTAKRTMFNLTPCENEFEQSFVDFCDFANDVAAFAKNAGPQKLMIDYLRPDGYRALYVPDFFVRENLGDYYLVELKGKTDTLVPVKAQAAAEWCKVASRKGVKWHYLYVPYSLFQQSSASSIAELARACEPSLRSLLDEAKTRQIQLPLAEETAKKDAEDFFTQICQNAGVKALPEAIDGTIRQAVALLDHAIKTRMPDLAHAFQPMLRLYDDYAIKILSQKLSPQIPARESERRDFFNPYLGAVDYRMRTPLEKNQRYLQQNLIHGRPIQKLGTLLFCLDYAQQGGSGVAGVWKAVAKIFADAGMKGLYDDLKKVNEVRNRHVAHSEAPLADPETAVEAMGDWVRCLDRMVNLAS